MVISEGEIAVFILVLARVGGMLVAAPVLGSRQVPVQSKIGLAVMLSLIFTPLLADRATLIPAGLLPFALLAGRELLVGLAVGLAVSLVVTGMQMGSRLVGVQMGFGLGGVLDPVTGNDSGVLDTFYMVLATLIFLVADGHHAMIMALARTFELAPFATMEAPAVDPLQVMAMIQAVVVVALRVVMPIMAALLLADVGLGLISRAAPQIQVLIVGMPIKIGLGLFVLAISTPMTAMLMRSLSTGVGKSVTTVFGG
jgi:flagellar biosynthesis protein FliR